MNGLASVTSAWLLAATFGAAACSERPAAEPEKPAAEPPASLQAPAAQQPPAAEKGSQQQAPAAQPSPSEEGSKRAEAAPRPSADEPKSASAPAAEAAPGDTKAAQPGAAPAAATPCGEEGQPQCPLQAWMERNLQTPLDDGDLQQVARNLARVPKLVPDPSWNRPGDGWSALAESGAQAAQRGDIEAVKQSCKSCHKTWRRSYKERFRQRPI
jgi:hypothetical protein